MRENPKPLPSAEEIARLPPDGGTQYNRLIHESSPYLLQHADNPVDWYPWGPEAFAEARRQDKPIFLSIGYSACHWCHVMERESFACANLAEILNRHYVAIKVDREERPDVDQVYMLATQMLTGSGGWPNSLWLTPDARPWYAGTYFPPEDGPGRTGLKTILIRLEQMWRTRRAEVNAAASRVLAQMEHRSRGAQHVEASGELTCALLSAATETLRRSFDSKHGGFGDAPKFPPHGALSLLFQEHRRRKDQVLLEMAVTTLDGMALGGIHDHLGGGFHRYSLDRAWLLPHFEKMLYDNAQLARAYVDAYRLTGNESYKLVAGGVYEWALREMIDCGGAFCSALDAESEGEEGKFYLWHKKDILDVLGPEAGEQFCGVYGVTDEGNFQDPTTREKPGTNIIHLQQPVPPGVAKRLADARQRLLAARDLRVRPRRDDKVLTGWNSLMIGSMAYGGSHLGKHQYVNTAEQAADFILSRMQAGGRLMRSFRHGGAQLNAYLDDYAFLGDALMDLYEATGNQRWLAEAERTARDMMTYYGDFSDGGFFFTANDHEKLLLRIKDPFDSSTPSGNGIAARLLVRLARQTGQQEYSAVARQTLEAFLGVMEQMPGAAPGLIAAAGMHLEATAP